MLESLFSKVSGPKACNFTEKRLQHSCLPVNIAKFLRTPILKHIYEWLLLKSIKRHITAQIMKFFMKDFFIKCDHTRNFLNWNRKLHFLCSVFLILTHWIIIIRIFPSVREFCICNLCWYIGYMVMITCYHIPRDLQTWIWIRLFKS